MYARILVPIDGSETGELGLREALALASALKSTLVLLNIVDDYRLLVEMSDALPFEEVRRKLIAYGDKVLAQAQRACAEAGVRSESAIGEVNGQRVADAIVDEALRRDCSLIVMGMHGRRGFERWALGSDAERVLRSAPVPVLLVRQPQAGRA
jgi:nucleotide-binding universal stress UspA family protein